MSVRVNREMPISSWTLRVSFGEVGPMLAFVFRRSLSAACTIGARTTADSESDVVRTNL